VQNTYLLSAADALEANRAAAGDRHPQTLAQGPAPERGVAATGKAFQMSPSL